MSSPAAPQGAEKGGKEIKELGLTLSAITKELKSRYELADDLNGVVVTKVEKEGSASEKGLRVGDVVVEINQEKVKSVAEVNKQVVRAKKAGRRSVLLLINQGGDLRFLALKIDSKKG